MRTAGEYPRPKPAIDLAIAAGLIKRNGRILVLTERGHSFAKSTLASGPWLSVEQSKVILAALTDDFALAQSVKTFVGNFQLIKGNFLARRSTIENSYDQRLVCRILQQITAVESQGDYLLITKAFLDVLQNLIIAAAKLSQQELLDRLERQRKRAELAEKKVIELEKKRLIGFKRNDLAAKIKHVGIFDVSAGYDILSFEKSGADRLIEVKSSVGSQVRFEWSEGERKKAIEEGNAYFIYFVPFSFSLPELTAPVQIIQNPVFHIANGALLETPSSYHVNESPAGHVVFDTLAP